MERCSNLSLGQGRTIISQLFHRQGHFPVILPIVHQQRIGFHSGLHPEGDDSLVTIARGQLTVEQIESLCYIVGFQVEAQTLDNWYAPIRAVSDAHTGLARPHLANR